VDPAHRRHNDDMNAPNQKYRPTFTVWSVPKEIEGQEHVAKFPCHPSYEDLFYTSRGGEVGRNLADKGRN